MARSVKLMDPFDPAYVAHLAATLPWDGRALRVFAREDCTVSVVAVVRVRGVRYAIEACRCRFPEPLDS